MFSYQECDPRRPRPLEGVDEDDRVANSYHPGFLSTASRKRGVTIESLKNGKGERVYRVNK
jgi:hypothetical protein